MPIPASCAQRFQPEALLATGGFGEVWRARQVGLDRQVALKVLHHEVLADPVQVDRFRREAQITATLSDPHIVVLVDHGVDDGVPWIAYELVTGASLRARVERGRMPWREACEVAQQVAQALEVAHAQGILHRDIKPDNILKSSEGHWKVADFGIAKLAGAKTLTAAGVILGTPSYLSPTQIKGDVPGPETDLYALGVTLFELIAGRPPFDAPTPVELLQLHLMKEPPLLSSLAPDVPRGLDRLVAQALAKNRAERFESAREMKEALAQVLRGSGRVVSPASRPPAPVRRTGMRELAVAIGLIAVALGVHGLLRRPAPPVAPAVSVADRPRIAGVRFEGPYWTAVATGGAVPVGASVHVSWGGPSSRAASSPTTPSEWLSDALPPDTDCVATLKDGETVLAVHRFHTPIAVPISSFAVFADFHGATVALRAAGPVRLELVTDDPAGPLRKLADVSLSDAARGATYEFRDLKDGKPYAVRVSYPGRWGGVRGYRFRTTDAYPIHVDEGSTPCGDLLISQLRFVPRWLAYLARQVPPLDCFLEFCVVARNMRHRALVDALVRLDSNYADPVSRAELATAALLAFHPEAVRLGVSALAEVARDDDANRLLGASEATDTPLPFDLILRARERSRTLDPALVAAALVTSSREKALMLAAGWEPRPADPGWFDTALHVCLQIDTPPAWDALRRLLAHPGATGRSEALAEIVRHAPERFCEAWGPGFDADGMLAAQYGCPAGRARLEAVARAGQDSGVLAVLLLGATGGSPVLLELTASRAVDLLDAVATALALSRPEGAAEAVARLRKLDRHGTILAAMIELAGQSAGARAAAEAEVRAVLEGPHRGRTTAVAAWGAGELGLTGSLARLDALARERPHGDVTRALAAGAAERLRGGKARTYLLAPYVAARTIPITCYPGDAPTVSALSSDLQGRVVASSRLRFAVGRVRVDVTTIAQPLLTYVGGRPIVFRDSVPHWVTPADSSVWVTIRP